MFFGSLAFIFEVMIYVGLGLPLANLLIGLIGGFGDAGADVGADLSADANLDLDLDVSADVDLDFDASGTQLDGLGTGADGIQQGVFVRFNIHCLCLALVVMGAVGVFALSSLEGMRQLATLIGGAALAIAAYVGLYRFVMLPLKKNDAAALNTRSLQFRHAIVTFRIAKDSPGKIETKDAVGATISYLAELDPHICKLDRIEEREEVVITEIDKSQNLCYVTLAQRKVLG